MNNYALGIISTNYSAGDFGPLTDRRPIAMIPFAGKYRLVDFALSNMVNAGITSVGIITPYYYRSVMDHVGNGKPWGLARKIGGLFMMPGTVYGKKLPGGRFVMRDLLRNRRIIDRCSSEYVIFSDSSIVMNTDYRLFFENHIKSGCPVTFMCKKQKNATLRGRLEIGSDGKVRNMLANDDPSSDNVFAGCFIMNRNYLCDIIKWYEHMDDWDILQILIEKVRDFSINTYCIEGYCEFIDNAIDYKRVSNDILKHKVRKELFENPDRTIYTKNQDVPPTVYKKGCSVSRSLVADGCVISGKAENSVIFRSSVIESGAVVKDSIILQHCVIKKGAIVENAIIDKYNTVTENAKISGGSKKPLVISKGNYI